MHTDCKFSKFSPASLPPLSLRITSPKLPFRKDQAFQEYQLNKAKQNTITLGTNPHQGWTCQPSIRKRIPRTDKIKLFITFEKYLVSHNYQYQLIALMVYKEIATY